MALEFGDKCPRPRGNQDVTGRQDAISDGHGVGIQQPAPAFNELQERMNVS